MNENANERKNRHSDDIYREVDRDDRNEKHRVVEDLLKSLRKKRESIVLQTLHLSSFNKRLELLLECFDAYSFENEKEESLEKARVPRDKKSATAGGSKSNLEEMCEDQRQPVASEEENNVEESVERRMDRIFNLKKVNSKVNKRLAVEIYNLIKANKNIPFDDLVKGIKQSKYKVVEIINTLIKEKLIIKTFDKGFVYKINKNIL